MYPDILIPVSFHPTSSCPLKTDTPSLILPPCQPDFELQYVELIIKGSEQNKNSMGYCPATKKGWKVRGMIKIFVLQL